MVTDKEKQWISNHKDELHQDWINTRDQTEFSLAEHEEMAASVNVKEDEEKTECQYYESLKDMPPQINEGVEK